MEPTPHDIAFLENLAAALDVSFYRDMHADCPVTLVFHDNHQEFVEPCRNWNTVANLLRHALATWAEKNKQRLFTIAIADAERTQQHYAARAQDLFGNHAMLNQDDHDAY